jgi:hypothetical protein
LQHQSPPAIFLSISNSHNHPTVILQYTSWSRSCRWTFSKMSSHHHACHTPELYLG